MVADKPSPKKDQTLDVYGRFAAHHQWFITDSVTQFAWSWVAQRGETSIFDVGFPAPRNSIEDWNGVKSSIGQTWNVDDHGPTWSNKRRNDLEVWVLQAVLAKLVGPGMTRKLRAISPYNFPLECRTVSRFKPCIWNLQMASSCNWDLFRRWLLYPLVN